MINYKIIPNNGHYEAWINGKFYCSADTMREAIKEVQDYFETCSYTLYAV